MPESYQFVRRERFNDAIAAGIALEKLEARGARMSIEKRILSIIASPNSAGLIQVYSILSS
jgi:hypothetical protein